MFKLKNIDLFKLSICIVVLVGLSVIMAQQVKITSVKERLVESNLLLEKQLKDFQNILNILDEKAQESQENLEDIENKVNEALEKINSLEKKQQELEKKVSSKELARKSLSAKSTTTIQNTKNVSESNNNANSQAKGKAIVMSLSFYSELSGICADGSKISYGAIASNVYPLGTKFLINGEVFTVRDRGGPHFNSYNRLDVFIPRKNGESNTDYRNRLLKLGRQTVTVYKLN